MSQYQDELNKRLFLIKGLKLGFSLAEMSELTGWTAGQVKHTIRRLAAETDIKTYKTCASLVSRVKKMSIEEYSEYLFAVGHFAVYIRDPRNTIPYAQKVIMSYEDYLSNYNIRKARALALGNSSQEFPSRCLANVFYRAVSKLTSGCLVLERCACNESFNIFDAGDSENPEHFDRRCPCRAAGKSRDRNNAIDGIGNGRCRVVK